jgi:hypothetical protein
MANEEGRMDTLPSLCHLFSNITPILMPDQLRPFKILGKVDTL